MARFAVFSCLLFYWLQTTAAHQPNALCSNEKTVFDRSCSTQILDGSFNSCTVKYYPTNSSECKEMEFGQFVDNQKLGGVILEPYIFTYAGPGGRYETNYTVLNVTFTNIKWNTMQFRFERKGGSTLKNHCRNIEIAHNITVREQSVLYYDCWWSDQDSIYVGENYILDFKAEGDGGVKRGQYYFTVPSVNQLSPTVKLKDYKPFMYIEIGGQSSLILHIKPAPSTLGIEKYLIEVMKACEECPGGYGVWQNATIKSTGEVTYAHSLLGQGGSFYFRVTPIHKDFATDPSKVCQSVKSPNIVITGDNGPVICIASVSCIVVALLFAYYILLRLVRRWWCREQLYWDKLTLNDESSKILVLYSATNKIHMECVNSFVLYLNHELGLNVTYDADIDYTNDPDPYKWFHQAFDAATTVIYIVGPPDMPNATPVTANVNFDKIQMNLLKQYHGNKQVINVQFPHSKAPIPDETINNRTFCLLKDWNKLISFLTKNQLPRIQLKRTEKGKRLYQNLEDARKHFGEKSAAYNVVGDVEMGVDKKALV